MSSNNKPVFTTKHEWLEMVQKLLNDLNESIDTWNSFDVPSEWYEDKDYSATYQTVDSAYYKLRVALKNLRYHSQDKRSIEVPNVKE